MNSFEWDGQGISAPRARATRRDKGSLGELTAVDFLQEQGYLLRERNWRCRSGEIDIIAEDEGSLVFVEVRSRSGSAYGTATESVNARKQAQVRHVAAIYMHMKGVQDWPVRFDVIAVQLLPDGKAQVTEHIRAAF
ncbi:YraN family protein [Paenibacillus massiliensis]|uniref:YraN family protein n=1 Tax=Paenibacillus massiliensis TaxID=225917 RepID=UPI00046F0396|nr:YraN family protein [Paenibacillus massiliensis]